MVPGGGESGRRRRWPLFVLLILGLLALDLARPPERQVSARATIAAIQLYRRTLSPWMPLLGARCRFEPSCSRYAETVIRRQGLLLGGARALARLARCGPWTPAGTVDLPG